MLRNKKIVFILALVMLFCTGCYDSKEIDETAYIIALGIDDVNDGEYKYTFQFSAPLAIAGIGGEKKSEGESKEETIKDSGNTSVNNVVIKAPDFYIAKNMINNSFSKNIDMSHLKIIVFSKDLDAEKLIHHSQLFLREREVRPHTSLAIAEKSAEEFIRSVNPELEVNTAKYYELMSLRSNNIYAPSKRLRDFVEETKDGGGSVLPVACVTKYENSEDFEEKKDENSNWVKSSRTRLSSSRTDMRGMAVFKGGEIKTIMDGDRALVFNMLNRNVKNFVISIRNINNPSENITFRIFVPDASKYKINETTLRVLTTVDAEYIGGKLPEGYNSYEEIYKQLKIAMEKEIILFFDTLIKNDADVMKIKKHYEKKFITLEEQGREDWKTIFNNMRIVSDVEII